MNATTSKTWVMTHNETATILLDCSGMDSADTADIFSATKGGGLKPIIPAYDSFHGIKPEDHTDTHMLPLFSGEPIGVHSFVQERIPEAWLEKAGYDAKVVVAPFDVSGPALPLSLAGMGRTIVFVRTANAAAVEKDLWELMTTLTLTGLVFEGLAKIDVFSIFSGVKHTWETFGDSEATITVRQFHENFWKRSGKNWVAVVHNFLQGLALPGQARVGKQERTGPVLEPIIHRKKPSSAGCRLSLSDIVWVGLLTGILARGARYIDLKGPTAFERISFQNIQGRFQLWLNQARRRKD